MTEASHRIQIFDTQETNKLISEDMYEIYTIFKYISSSLTYHDNCLKSLKILEIGSSTGENLSLALSHGASFVAGLDPSFSLVSSSSSQFEKSGIDSSKYYFTRANIFSYASCELSLDPAVYSNYFDKVFSCWAISQAKSLSEVNELVSIGEKYLKSNGDMVLVFVNPQVVFNFPQVKLMPRIENFDLVEVNEVEDHFQVQARILEPFSGEELMRVSYNVFALEDIEKIAQGVGLVVKRTGGLEMVPSDELVNLPFQMICKEISKEVTLGFYMHLKKRRV